MWRAKNIGQLATKGMEIRPNGVLRPCMFVDVGLVWLVRSGVGKSGKAFTRSVVAG